MMFQQRVCKVRSSVVQTFIPSIKIHFSSNAFRNDYYSQKDNIICSTGVPAILTRVRELPLLPVGMTRFAIRKDKHCAMSSGIQSVEEKT